eukprot:TRINITY_DN5694_c0_g1_i1.p1 TRINITY_DN5694_c0_g1~~TRINITY_DN5694_c0_g1_i1.p1  ORF type:complete len:177 (-),score=28.11 TRINITY_DN5694_c0_g1_i1:93-623(-)
MQKQLGGFLYLLAHLCLGRAAAVNSEGVSFSAPLQSTENGVDLGLQLDATVMPHREKSSPGVATVTLVSSNDGPATGLGPQLSATVHDAVGHTDLGLGPQLDARITPGKPKQALRGIDKVESSAWAVLLLRLAFLLAGMFLVYFALDQQSAEQGRQSRFKKLLSALRWNRTSGAKK